MDKNQLGWVVLIQSLLQSNLKEGVPVGWVVMQFLHRMLDLEMHHNRMQRYRIQYNGGQLSMQHNITCGTTI